MIPIISVYVQILPTGSITLATSQTGPTLYMEPRPVILLNNAVSELRTAEEEEELEVLTALTCMLREHHSALRRALNAIASIDLAMARARHSKYDLFTGYVSLLPKLSIRSAFRGKAHSMEHVKNLGHKQICCTFFSI